jgi:hypothetical protein
VVPLEAKGMVLLVMDGQGVVSEAVNAGMTEQIQTAKTTRAKRTTLPRRPSDPKRTLCHDWPVYSISGLRTNICEALARGLVLPTSVDFGGSRITDLDHANKTGNI